MKKEVQGERVENEEGRGTAYEVVEGVDDGYGEVVK